MTVQGLSPCQILSLVGCSLSSAGITRPHRSYGLSDSQTGRRPLWRRSGPRPPGQSRASLTNPGHLPASCSLPRWTGSGARWLASGAVPRRFLPCLCCLPLIVAGRRPQLYFEACSSSTRLTACTVAHPPYVGFIARLRPGQLPGSDARMLSSSTNNLLEWVLPPLVI